MSGIEVNADFQPLIRKLDDLAKRQVPFAAARALTLTAQHAAASIKEELPNIFDKPTPFTERGIAARGAKKGKVEGMSATVFVRPKQAEYLQLEEEGGVQTPKKRALVMPVGIRRNKHGNIPDGEVKRLLADKKHNFSGTVRGIAGIWQRPDYGLRKRQHFHAGNRPNGTKGALNKKLGFLTGLKLLVSYASQAVHNAPRFKFKERAKKDIEQTATGFLKEELAKAIKTAK